MIWIIQLVLIIHVLKSGRNRLWIMMLLFLPLIGGIAYLVIELLPQFSGSLTGQRAVRNVRKTLNPGAATRHHKAAWEQSPNVDNARRYAQALLDAGKNQEAESIVDKALTGLFETEPTLLLLKAQISFEQGQADKTVAVLESLQQNNPDFRTSDGHLLYARALEETGEIENAIKEYSAVSGYFPGVEARYRLAKSLIKAGNGNAGQSELESILTDAKLAPAHFRKSQKTWLEAVRKELNQAKN